MQGSGLIPHPPSTDPNLSQLSGSTGTQISPWETYQDLFGTRVATSLGTSLPVQRSQILDLSLGPEQKQLLPFRSFTEAQPGLQHRSHPVGLLTSEAQAA